MAISCLDKEAGAELYDSETVCVLHAASHRTVQIMELILESAKGTVHHAAGTASPLQSVDLLAQP